MSARRSTNALSWAAAAAVVLVASRAAADDGGPSTREAARHFDRGVALYEEADYRAALVEFRRAYELAPNATVLYNVGESLYQLHDYAGALDILSRFLAESVPSDPHRSEVEKTVETLRARIGHLTIVTSPPGADVSVDDQPVGETPLRSAITVSVGRRKVTASKKGRVSVIRYVDVSAEDDVTASLDLPEASEPPGTAPPIAVLHPASPPLARESTTWRTVGWIATGTLAAGAIGCGVFAFDESRRLKDARNAFPASSQTLHDDANRTLALSIAADSLTAAAAVVGVITLYATVSASGASKGQPGTEVRASLGPRSAHLTLTF
jgi:hypothetical protein